MKFNIELESPHPQNSTPNSPTKGSGFVSVGIGSTPEEAIYQAIKALCSSEQEFEEMKRDFQKQFKGNTEKDTP